MLDMAKYFAASSMRFGGSVGSFDNAFDFTLDLFTGTLLLHKRDFVVATNTDHFYTVSQVEDSAFHSSGPVSIALGTRLEFDIVIEHTNLRFSVGARHPEFT